MLIAGVLCVCAAAVAAGFGTWSLSQNQAMERTASTATTALGLRAMAPTQLAAAVMLAAGGVVALVASPHTALVLVIVCVCGALGTLAAGSWQIARFALRGGGAQVSYQAECKGNCVGCNLSCH
jgi:hypothetical protein